MDTLIHLVPTFLVLSDCLNVSHAAKELGLSQPAVSRQLNTLEESLGVSLFLRKSRGLVLTAAGLKLRQELLSTYTKLRESLTSVRCSSSLMEGEIVFGCFSEIGQKLFVPLLLEFSRKHPKITLDIRLSIEEEIAEQVGAGNLGLGISTRVPTSEIVRAHKLTTETIVVVASAENPIDLEKCASPQFVGFRKMDPLLSNYLKRFSKKSLAKSDIVVAVNSHASMLESLRKRAFYAVLPLRSVEACLNDGTLRIASKHSFQNVIYLIVPQHDFQERRYREVVKFLLERTKEEGIRETRKMREL